MLKLGNIDIGGVFLGGTEISEAYLGSQLVFSANKAFPRDGVLLGADGAAYVTSVYTWDAKNSYWAADTPSGAYIELADGVVFGKNSTKLTFVDAWSSITGKRRVRIDGTSIGAESWGGSISRATVEYDIPAQYLDGQPHTITMNGPSSIGGNRFASCYFNV